MSLSTVKGDLASNRFQLLRIEPRAYVNDDLTLDGSDYEMTFLADSVSKVTRNATELTKVTTLSGNDQYTYDESTRELRIRIASAPSDSNIICVHFYLFFTGEKYRRLPETPTNVSSTIRNWEPRLASYVSTNQSVTNSTNGVLTYADTGFTLVNGDSSFENYLDIDVSFSNAEVLVWQCINSIDYIDLVYKGLAKNISLQGGTVTFSVFDPFTKLSEDPFIGDSEEECIVTKTTTDWTLVNEKSNGKPVPFVFGDSSPHDLEEGAPYFSEVPAYYHPNPFKAYTGICIDYLESSSPKREFTLCRVDSSGLRTLDFGTTVRQSNGGGSSTDSMYYITGHNLKVGDCFRLNASGSEYGFVTYVGDFTYSGSTYNVAVSGNGAFNWPYPDLAASAYSNDAPIVFIRDENGEIYRLIPTRDFTWSETATSGGNKRIDIEFTSSMESNHAGLTTFDPDKHEVGYIVRPDTSYTHATALKKIIESSGLSVNAASFTQADSDLSAKALFTIPFIGNNGQFGTIRDYAEAITKSTMSYLKINSSGEVEYKLVDAPTSTDTIDERLYNQVNSTVDYNDVVHELVASNKHAITTELVSGTSMDSSYAKETSLRAKYLHSINKSERFEHVLESISGRIADILAIRSERSALYSFTTATHNIDSEIGDDVLLTSDRILGGYATKSLKVLSIRKTSHNVEVEADDLGRLT